MGPLFGPDRPAHRRSGNVRRCELQPQCLAVRLERFVSLPDRRGRSLAGLQLADLIAHPSRNEILSENGHPVTIAPFATMVIAVLQDNYDRPEDRVFGKKML